MTLKREEVTHIDPNWAHVIIASGPLTSPLYQVISKMTGSDKLAFDAIAPIVMTVLIWIFVGTVRYDKSGLVGMEKTTLIVP